MSVLPADLPDRDARNQAVTDFRSNLVVEAGAGTGKTSLLVERILIALGAGYAAIEELTAITFTEKAAAEMRTRLAAGLELLLSMARGDAVPTDPGIEAVRAWAHLSDLKVSGTEVQQRTLASLDRIDQAQVVTIHTFCAGLLRAWPMEAGVDPGFEIDQGDHYDRIREQEWERFVVRDLAAGSGRQELWRPVLQRVGLGDLREVAFELAGFGIPADLREDPGRPTDPEKLFGDRVTRFLTSADELLAMREPVKKAPLPVELLAALYGALMVWATEGQDRFREHVSGHSFLKKRIKKYPGYKPSGTGGFAGVDREQLRETIADGMKLVMVLASFDDETAGAILGLVAPFADGAREQLLRNGFVGFDGLLVLARDLLREHPTIRESVRRRIRMLLVDEFQDTDPVQYEIVLYLSERSGEAAADPYAANLEPGRLFVVGDPKQSIYRFRGADFAAFKTAVDRILSEGGIQLTLSANFRTVPEVLNPVNRLFDETGRGCWQPEPRHQPPYVLLEPTRPTTGRAEVELWNTPPLSDGENPPSAYHRRSLEAAAIAAGIRQMTSGDGGTNCRDIMILVRAFSNLEIYLRALRDNGIPYVVDGGKGFMERSEVAQLIATARAVALPSDQAALLVFLRSPAGGVSDVQLASWSADEGFWDWRRAEEVDGAGHPEIRQSFRLLADLAESIRSLPVDHAIRTIVRVCGMEATGALGFEGFQRVANLEKICAIASELARDGRLSLVDLVDVLKDERFTESDSESPMADEKTDAVRVLSIHKAKGLENDVIIIPDLARSTGHHDDAKLEVVRLPDGSHAPSIRIRDLRNLASFHRELEEKAHEEAESIRLLYVALTRAKKRLIVLSGRSDRRAPWVEAIAPWADDADVRHVEMEDLPPRRREQGPVPILDTTSYSESYETGVAGLTAASRPPFQAPSTHDEERYETSEDPDLTPSGSGILRDEAKALGTAVHVALENWDPANGSPSTNHADALKLLTAFESGPLGKRFREIDIVGREVPMLLQDDGFAWRGSIDLLYKDGDAYVVADFKTDMELTEDRKKNYGEQLQRYAEAVRMTTEQPVRCELWMIRSGEIIRLPR